MAAIDHLAPSGLPGWLRRYLNQGLEGKTRRQARRQFNFSVMMGLSALAALVYAAGYLLYNPAVWPTSIIAAGLFLFFLSLPWALRKNRDVTVIVGTFIVCAGFIGQSYLLSAHSGIYLYTFIIPGVWLATLGPSRIWQLLMTTLMVAATIWYCRFQFTEPALEAARDPAFQTILMTTSVINVVALILGFGYVAFLRAERAEEALEAEFDRSEALLYNLLPGEIAARLKAAPERTIADGLPNVAILFADIVDFTPRAASMTPEALVGNLNRVFSAFDELAEKHGAEKIKTIGDAYMAAAGVPRPSSDAVHRIAALAFDMIDTASKLDAATELRIGLHVGPVVAGVIGHRKLFYDVWGETVNTASRMESHGVAGRIQVTGEVREALRGTYAFEPRGEIDVKGMGPVETWWLLRPAPA